jgi:hypothetical protein
VISITVVTTKEIGKWPTSWDRTFEKLFFYEEFNTVKCEVVPQQQQSTETLLWYGTEFVRKGTYEHVSTGPLPSLSYLTT